MKTRNFTLARVGLVWTLKDAMHKGEPIKNVDINAESLFTFRSMISALPVYSNFPFLRFFQRSTSILCSTLSFFTTSLW